MSKLTFEDDISSSEYMRKSGHYLGRDSSKGLAAFLVKIGLVKNTSQANLILITFIIICLVATFWIFSAGSDSNKPFVVDGKEVKSLQEVIATKRK